MIVGLTANGRRCVDVHPEPSHLARVLPRTSHPRRNPNLLLPAAGFRRPIYRPLWLDSATGCPLRLAAFWPLISFTQRL